MKLHCFLFAAMLPVVFPVVAAAARTTQDATPEMRCVVFDEKDSSVCFVLDTALWQLRQAATVSVAGTFNFWDADAGCVTVGGVYVATVDPEVLLRDFAVVFQDVLLFDDTVMGNIRLGRRGATDEEVLAAARAANCDEFVSRLPKGYDTMIGENGSKLSGGERQRISIARALLKDAPVVLLDEATASLDVENETQVQEALSHLLLAKTVIVIAHRMRTVMSADKIVVLDGGRVVEQGSPGELLAANGLFARMVHLQTASAEWTL